MRSASKPATQKAVRLKTRPFTWPWGVTPEGEREVLGLWIANNEGAKFWLSVMNNLRNRGVEDILIAVVDGLKGLPDAITAAFPRYHRPDLHRASGAPFPELLRLEG